MPFISIQLNSNRPKSFVEFLDNIEETADRPEDIEVLVHIDKGDIAMEEVVAREKARRILSLRELQTDLVKGYATLWMPLNPLFQLTHPEAYFVSNLFDEVRFETKGWDSILRTYKHYYPDDIFRLRASKFRFRNYMDFWECGYAPDSLAFYTQRWLALGGDWNPCLGPDSFQQLVAFYLMADDTSAPRQFNRDIALPELRFSGEGAGNGLVGEARNRWLCINNRAWYVLMSQRMQQEAKRRAMRLKSHIVAYENGGDKVIVVEEDKKKQRFLVKEAETGRTISTIPYDVSWWQTSGVNLLRTPNMQCFSGAGLQMKAVYRSQSFCLVICSRLPLSYGPKLFTKIQEIRGSIKSQVYQKIVPHAPFSQLISESKKWTGYIPWKDKKSDDEICISLLVNGSNIQNFSTFLEAVEKTAIHSECIEIIVGDTSKDKALKALVEQASGRKMRLSYSEISNDNSMTVADQLFLLASRSAYFIAYMDDKLEFQTPGWDNQIKSCIGYYPDHIFRIRCSQNRFRNYRGLEECFLAPDTITFYTRDWLSIQEGFGKGISPDIFQQCVSFYLFTSDPFSHTQYYRDIVLPHMHFSGQKAATSEVSVAGTVPYEEMKRRAMLLKGCIISEQSKVEKVGSSVEILENKSNKMWLIEQDGKIITGLSYEIPVRTKKVSNFFYIKSVLSYVRDKLTMGKYTDAVHHV